MRNIWNKIKVKVSSFRRKKLDDYWIQRMSVKVINNRLDVFDKYVRNKKVLHIGCTDFPIFNPKNNLHLQLSKVCGELHGMDLDENGLNELRKYFDGSYFNNLSDVDSYYDTILVPETIEHVANIQMFLSSINAINAKNYIITGPNCFHDFFNNGLRNGDKIFIEAVHPDHNCWFSPYTLKNAIQKYTTLKVDEIYLANDKLMIICVCSR